MVATDPAPPSGPIHKAYFWCAGGKQCYCPGRAEIGSCRTVATKHQPGPNHPPGKSFIGYQGKFGKRGDAPHHEEAGPSSREEGSQRRLAAIFSADVEGYTRLMNADEASTIRTLTARRKRMAELIGQRHGRVVDSPGDNVLGEFPSAVDAVECAVGVQSALAAENAPLPPERRMEFRIGINVGDVVAEGDRIYGDGVNVAARVERLAEAGGICISGSVYDQVKNKLALAYEDLGPQTLKNVREPVRVYRVKAGADDAPRGTTSVPVARRWRTAALASAALLLLLSAISAMRAAWFNKPIASPDHSRRLALPDKPSIAILPFTNLSGDSEQEYFSTGITEDLITDASKLAGLFVIAHDSVLPYRAKAINVQDVGRDLGVMYILEGSVRKTGDEVRISARLMDASNGHQLWAQRYDRKAKDTFAVQDDVLQHIISDLQVEVADAEWDRIRRIPTQNLNAYESFMRAVGLTQRRMSKESRAQALELLQRSIDLDPTFANAYVARGFLLLDDLVTGRDTRLLRELAERALALNESLPLGHILLAFVRFGEKRSAEAIDEVDRAIALGPNDADVYAHAAGIYNATGKSQEAIPMLEKAMRLNPRYPDWYLLYLGRAYAQTERYEEAVAALKKLALSQPDFLNSHIMLAGIYRKLGRQAEATAEEAEIRRLNPVEEILVENSPETLGSAAAFSRLK
jgi:adenylate cyclase